MEIRFSKKIMPDSPKTRTPKGSDTSFEQILKVASGRKPQPHQVRDFRERH